jgi:hypothetical protein
LATAKHLSLLLAAMKILAFLYHTFLSFTDANYRLIRAIIALLRESVLICFAAQRTLGYWPRAVLIN